MSRRRAEPSTTRNVLASWVAFAFPVAGWGESENLPERGR